MSDTVSSANTATDFEIPQDFQDRLKEVMKEIKAIGATNLSLCTQRSDFNKTITLTKELSEECNHKNLAVSEHLEHAKCVLDAKLRHNQTQNKL